MIHLTRSGTVSTYSRAEMERLSFEFREHHCITLPGLLPSGMLEMLRRQIAHAEFETRIHRHVTPHPVDFCMKANACSGLLHFLTNDPLFLALVEELTQVGDIGGFAGSVYRLDPSPATSDVWHSDAQRDRMLALSLNLSVGAYSGGLLQIRERRSQRIVHQVANIGSGDAILFAIAPTLQHRVSPIEGTVSRTAFAGWFHAAPRDRPPSTPSLWTSTGDLPSETGPESASTDASSAANARMTSTLQSEIRVADEIFFRAHDDVLVLYDARVGSSYALNRVGRRIWVLLSENHTLPAVMDLLAREYDVPPENLHREVLALVEELAAAGLVTIVEKPAEIPSMGMPHRPTAHPERHA